MPSFTLRFYVRLESEVGCPSSIACQQNQVRFRSFLILENLKDDFEKSERVMNNERRP